MRLLCLYFPRLAVRLAVRQRPQLDGRAVVLIEGHGDQVLVSAASCEAVAAGIIPGITAGQARARASGAAFVPDNAGDCLAELERVAGVIRLRATPLVEIAARDHLVVDLSGLAGRFPDEGEAARRLAGLVQGWTGLEVRAAVASTRTEAFQAARAARRFPIVCPVVDAAGTPVSPYDEHASLSAAETFPARTSDLAARARLVRLLTRLGTLLEARGQSFRELRLEFESGERNALLAARPPRPLNDPLLALDLLAAQVPEGGLDGVRGLRVTLLRLGPDVRTRACAASTRSRSQAEPPVARALRQAS